MVKLTYRPLVESDVEYELLMEPETEDFKGGVRGQVL
jgi:hypothetical protein